METDEPLWAALKELSRRLARIEDALRHVPSGNDDAEETGQDFRFGDGTVSRSRFAYVNTCGECVSLSRREVELLEMFAGSPDEVLSRGMLLDRLWGIDFYGNTRTLDQHIARLRRKLGADGGAIVTVSRVGYAYRPDSAKWR